MIPVVQTASLTIVLKSERGWVVKEKDEFFTAVGADMKVEQTNVSRLFDFVSKRENPFSSAQASVSHVLLHQWIFSSRCLPDVEQRLINVFKNGEKVYRKYRGATGSEECHVVSNNYYEKNA